MAELYKGIEGSPITYLTSDISASQTTISIDDDSALPDAPNICTIGYGEHLETIKYETKSNGVLQNVTRGIEGTPRSWQAGTEVARFFTAYDHNKIIDKYNDLTVNFNEHLADYESLRSKVAEREKKLFSDSSPAIFNLSAGSYYLLYAFVGLNTSQAMATYEIAMWS
ncbi:MAG TPA: hypothetical protein VK031_05860, partial [Tissierellaceae bacterium]|nr:hypothetical protein [Tissierellaceae bacterium]